ncbi:hypothetical protein HAX54_001497 [Datura stramonium]|uniref:MADS-box domain-containing protein n=1 Tax=Datura stramonium TaxID=4076 RepID=A0ABS8T2H1_DATST|nr:hypothetical protein [Datura stramonium]
MKAKKSAFLKRKACVMKKTMELSVLCDVKACAIIIDADGTVETWPKNSTDLNPILDRYRQKHSSNNKKQSNNVDVLSKLNSKIESVKTRIEFLKGKSIRNGDESDAEREEFSEILRQITGSSVEEIGAADEHQCPLGYWDGGPIEEQQCPLGYWNGGPIEEQQCPLGYWNGGPIEEQQCPLEYYWDGHIDCNYGQHEQPCPDYWDFGAGSEYQCHPTRQY